MRTTLTLDDDVARLVDEAVHEQRRPMKQIVNDALRKALSAGTGEPEPYVLPVHHSALRPGIDPAGMNKLIGELEDEEIIALARRDA